MRNPFEPPTYTLPVAPGRSVSIWGAFPLSEVEWQRMLSVLEVMKDGLVRENKTVGAISKGGEVQEYVGGVPIEKLQPYVQEVDDRCKTFWSGFQCTLKAPHDGVDHYYKPDEVA